MTAPLHPLAYRIGPTTISLQLRKYNTNNYISNANTNPGCLRHETRCFEQDVDRMEIMRRDSADHRRKYFLVLNGWSTHTCVINVFSLFVDMLSTGLYNQALADVRSTGAGIKCLYCSTTWFYSTVLSSVWQMFWLLFSNVKLSVLVILCYSCYIILAFFFIIVEWYRFAYTLWFGPFQAVISTCVMVINPSMLKSSYESGSLLLQSIWRRAVVFVLIINYPSNI